MVIGLVELSMKYKAENGNEYDLATLEPAHLLNKFNECLRDKFTVNDKLAISELMIDSWLKYQDSIED